MARVAWIGLGLVCAGGVAHAQTADRLIELANIPAVAGFEQNLAERIERDLKDYKPVRDSAGNLLVTVGSGAPVRLIATPIDEPGYVVSGITEDGYLRVQRLPQAAPNAVFDALEFAQPVEVGRRQHGRISGVFAGLSVHLYPGRLNPPKMNHPDELFVDIGAKSGAEVRAAGAELLDPVAMTKRPLRIGATGVEGQGVGDRFGAAALIDMLENLDAKGMKGTLIVAFVTQQWIGGRGLNRLLTETHPDEMVYVGRMFPDAQGGEKEAEAARSGLVFATHKDETTGNSLPDELEKLAAANGATWSAMPAAMPKIAGYVKGASFPARFAHVSVAMQRPVTPAETLDEADVKALRAVLTKYTGGQEITREPKKMASVTLSASPLQMLALAYGASGHEAVVRGAVTGQLPDWARKRVTTDAAGNLVLHLGDGKRGANVKSLAFVAHMDELGYEVKEIREDGRLKVDVLGGGFTQYFLGHPALVHKKSGGAVGAAMELPAGWDKPGFEWPSGTKTMDDAVIVDVGTRTKADTEKLGVAVGDYVTIPKAYWPLQGTRANARSFDDRVGCEALIEAVKALGPDLPGRDVTFVWSTEEEVGLKGAAAFAEQAAKDGNTPDFVFAIDTFVSSDSPLESKRFGDAKIGDGFVVRAVDNSNVAPREYVDRVVALAKENGIPVQFGVTGGGNDGAVFTRFGSVDIPMGWPLRYSHSPAEVIDTKDMEALGKIVTVIARKW